MVSNSEEVGELDADPTGGRVPGCKAANKMIGKIAGGASISDDEDELDEWIDKRIWRRHRRSGGDSGWDTREKVRRYLS